MSVALTPLSSADANPGCPILDDSCLFLRDFVLLVLTTDLSCFAHLQHGFALTLYLDCIGPPRSSLRSCPSSRRIAGKSLIFAYSYERHCDYGGLELFSLDDQHLARYCASL